MNSEHKSRARIIIAGAGFSGAATAWWLKQLGENDVILLEREHAAGIQASGQNAAMARQATADPFTTRLLAEGARFMATPPAAFVAPGPVLRRSGSVLLGSESRLKKFADVLQLTLPADEFEMTDGGKIALVSYLSGVKAPAALYTRGDGFINLSSLLAGFLRGADVRTSCRLVSAVRRADGWTVRTTSGNLECGALVIATGAWAGASAAATGALPLPIQPTRRHLFQTTAKKEYDQDAPFVWDVSNECYVRPDGAGHLFLSACDQDPYDPATPLLPDPLQLPALKGKIARSFPALARVEWRRFWPGTRALTPDGRFIIGPDAAVDRLFWVAGLGGHGVTASPAVGRIAAESILGIHAPPPEVNPGRFVSAPAG